jgi:tetratricopeptide (TPR) repeat protein
MKNKYTYLIIIFLIVASCAAFGRIAGNDFINLDDNGYITENYHVHSGINLQTIEWAFTVAVVNNWVPLAMISHMLDWSLFGANASGHHIVSLLLHIGAIIFLFLFLYKTTNNIWSAAFAAALFALHPLRVESIAWAAERKDVLSMFFGMAALYAYAFYAESLRLSHYFICLILFIMSLLSKSMLVTLPFVLLLLDYWPLGRWQEEINSPIKNRFQIINRLILEKIPFILLTIISSIITFLVQDEAGTVYPSFLLRVSNAIVAYAAYLGKTFWPVDLTLSYFYVYSFSAWQIIVSCFILLGISIIVISFIKKIPFLFVGWFWYLGTLIPVIGLVPTSALLADHYTYLPSIGITVMLAWGISSIIRSEDAKRKILFPAAILVLTVLIVLTWRQCGYWKNSFELWNHALQVTNDNHYTHHSFASAIFAEGKVEEAIYHYNEAIRLKSDFAHTYNDRGVLYGKINRYQNAMEDFNKTIHLEKDYAEAFYNRGTLYGKLGNYDLAIEDLNKAISLESDYVDAYYNRGYFYAKLGQNQLAIDDYNKVMSMNPNFIDAY